MKTRFSWENSLVLTNFAIGILVNRSFVGQWESSFSMFVGTLVQIQVVLVDLVLSKSSEPVRIGHLGPNKSFLLGY